MRILAAPNKTASASKKTTDKRANPHPLLIHPLTTRREPHREGERERGRRGDATQGGSHHQNFPARYPPLAAAPLSLKVSLAWSQEQKRKKKNRSKNAPPPHVPQQKLLTRAATSLHGPLAPKTEKKTLNLNYKTTHGIPTPSVYYHNTTESCLLTGLHGLLRDKENHKITLAYTSCV